MRRWTSLVFLLCAACGAAHSAPDAGPPDAGPPDAGAGPPDAGPTGCESFVSDGERACVPRGPFLFGWIVDSSTCPSCDEDDEKDLQMVRGAAEYRWSLAHELWTDAFLVDLEEVSIGGYADFLAATGRSPPPPVCENTPNEWRECEDLVGATGWSAAGDPPAERLDHPVTCVTRDEAALFCAWRGGRLPLSTEWMKAARGALPSRREFPWGDDIAALWARGGNETGEELQRRLAWVSEENVDPGVVLPCEEELEINLPDPVGSRPENASPYGLLHVLGNAAEWVRVADTDDNYEELKRDVLGGGFGSASVLWHWRYRDHDDYWWFQISYGISALATFRQDAYGPTSRERTLGFRCAYDVPER